MKVQEYISVDDLKVSKDFMEFKQRESGEFNYCEVIYCTSLPCKTNFAYTIEVNQEKKGRQIFSKIVRGSKLTRQRTLQVNNAHLNRSRC